jgi:hypothetical protein
MQATAQSDPCQPRPEFNTAGEHKTDTRALEFRLVITRIRECSCATLDHFRSLCKAKCHVGMPPLQTLSIPGSVHVRYTKAAKAKGLPWRVDRSSGGRRNDVEGVSPNSFRYATAKRPSSQRPNSVAISVTVALVELASKSARCTKCIRRSQRYRTGPMPSSSWQQACNVRSDVQVALQISAR